VRRTGVHTRIVDQDVERAFDSIGAASDRIRVGNVELLDASTPDRSGLAWIADCQDDIVISCEIARDGEPDSTVCSGDEGGRHVGIDARTVAALP